MASTKPVPIMSKAGVQRDGTAFDSNYYLNGQWMRFQRGRPRKMGGYQQITNALPEVARGLNLYASNGINFVHAGGATALWQYQFGLGTGLVAANDRTPAAFSVSAKNSWQFSVMYDTVSATKRLIAYAGQNLVDISSDAQTPIYYGDVLAATALTTTGHSVSGGAAVLYPYLIGYGNSWDWTVPNKPNDWAGAGSGAAVPVGDKIVYGLPLRGGNSAPAGLFWSLGSVFRAYFVGGTALWAFDVLTTQSSILSNQAVIEYDGVYYWAGVDRFLMFNGVMQELPNDMNLNYFYDNVNPLHTQKVFVFKVPRFGEIWWCYPHGSATECNRAVIFNVRERVWYDTALPEGGRSAAIFAQAFPRPFLSGVNFNTASAGYALWQHETGVDKIEGTRVSPIQSSFETGNLTFLVGDASQSAEVHVAVMEPDIVQTGDMTVQMLGSANVRAPDLAGPVRTIVPVPATPQEQVVNFKEARRIGRFLFESNTVGGDYQMGYSLVHIAPGSERVTT